MPRRGGPPRGNRIATPTHVLWQDHDRIYPRAWSDTVDQFFSDVTIHAVNGVGHFVPVEAPRPFSDALRAAVAGH